MNPNKDYFDVRTIETMNQIASLLFASRELRSLAKQFDNSDNLDKTVLDPDAIRILNFTRDTATALVNGLFQKKSKIESKFEAIYSDLQDDLCSAIQSARILAKAETNDVNKKGGAGDVIRRNVLVTLVQIRDVWNVQQETNLGHD